MIGLLAMLAGLFAPFARPVAASSNLTVDPPEITAQAVYSIDVTAGVELYALNADERRAPASITKLVTAMVLVNEMPDLSQQVEILDEDVSRLAAGESNMGLQAGDLVTLQDLLDGILIQSGSEAAFAAERIVGEQLLADGASADNAGDAFIAAMNQIVADLGLQNTHFVNPDGIDERDHYSSARDLAILSEKALEDPAIAGSVDKSSLQVFIDGPNPRDVTLQNTNQLLGDTIHGVKTGSTDEAGACVSLASTVHGTNQVITVVLGSDLQYDEQGFITVDKRWDDANAILAAVNSDLAWLDPANPDEVPGLSDELAAWQVKLDDDSAIVVQRSDRRKITYSLQIGPAAAQNSQVGNVLFFIGSEKVAEKPVFQA
jgi:D-alanyl-D-alanine carboxypeptidase (penicillin-binding protein 5/6)